MLLTGTGQATEPFYSFAKKVFPFIYLWYHHKLSLWTIKVVGPDWKMPCIPRRSVAPINVLFCCSAT
jgi:hypothetical protein